MGDKISKKNLLIVVGVLIIIAIIFILVSLFSDTKTIEKDTDNINPFTNEAYLSEKEVQKKIEDMNIYENLDIVVNNLYDFVKVYKGDLATKDYTDYIRDLNKNFSSLYEDVAKSNTVEQYFNANKDEITKKYGITDADNFKKLAEYISIYSTQGLSYKDVTLVKDSVVAEKDYTTTKVNITYSNDVTKTLNIAVVNDSKSGNPEFIVSFE